MTDFLNEIREQAYSKVLVGIEEKVRENALTGEVEMSIPSEDRLLIRIQDWCKQRRLLVKLISQQPDVIHINWSFDDNYGKYFVLEAALISGRLNVDEVPEYLLEDFCHEYGILYWRGHGEYHLFAPTNWYDIVGRLVNKAGKYRTSTCYINPLAETGDVLQFLALHGLLATCCSRGIVQEVSVKRLPIKETLEGWSQTDIRRLVLPNGKTEKVKTWLVDKKSFVGVGFTGQGYEISRL